MAGTTLRYAVSAAVIAAASLCGAAAAFAAGTITIEQESLNGSFAEWTLTTPMGTKENKSKQQTVTIQNAEEGQYLLKVDAPAGAVTTLKFFKGQELIKEAEKDEFGFFFTGNGEIRAHVSFRYNGIVEVDSVPQGASFELAGGPGMRYTGVTPQTFENLAPLQYTVNFSEMEGCQRPRSQTRSLEPGMKLSFVTDYICEDEIAAMNAQSSASSAMMDFDMLSGGGDMTTDDMMTTEESDQPNVVLSIMATQQETVPGGSVQVTLGMRNTGRSTMDNATISLQYDSSAVMFPDALPENGQRSQGNVITWTIPTIFAGQSWTVSLPVTFSETLMTGDHAVLVARASGEGIEGNDDEDLTKTIEVGIAKLPATGARYDTLFVAAVLLTALILTSLVRRKTVLGTTV